MTTSFITEPRNPSPSLMEVEDLIEIRVDQKIYIVYKSSQDDLFQAWWTRTSFFLQDDKQRNLWKSQHRQRGDIWKNFQQIAVKITGEPFLRCNHCNSIQKHPSWSGHGPGGITRHLKSVGCLQLRGEHQNIRNGLENMRKRQRTNSDLAIPTLSPDNFREQLLRLCISLNLPLRAVENSEFRTLLQMLNSHIQIPHRSNLRSSLDTHYNNDMQQLGLMLKKQQKISLAVDAWTSTNNLSFLGTVCYFIDEDWNYKEKLIGFEPLKSSHTGEYMAEVLMTIIKNDFWDISSALLAITTDNAANNFTMTQSLERKLVLYRWNGKRGHIPCVAHVIQLVVQALVKALNIEPENTELTSCFDENDVEIDTQVTFPSTLSKIRHIANAISTSPKQQQRFHDIQATHSSTPPLNMIQDVRTRWSSTYEMAVRALRLKDAVNHWVQNSEREKIRALKLSEPEWAQLKYVIGLLYIFYTTTKAVSITVTPMMQAAWWVYNRLFTHLETQMTRVREEQSWDATISSAIKQARDKLAEYYARTNQPFADYYAVAAVLDPSRRINAYAPGDWTEEERQIYVDIARTYYNDNYQQYEQENTQIEESMNHDSLDLHSLIASENLTKRNACNTEFDRYLHDDPVNVKGKSILDLWRMISSQYPTVAMMARDILAIPLAGVGIERKFNSSRDICHYRRGQLQGETVKKLMMVKHGKEKEIVDKNGIVMEYSSNDTVEEKIGRDCI
ncbi:hypothetical protein I7I50_03800 [Histoplasma capsulatum G186AR]|nr:hypothetical protein I7I50_03800 [Histoplasma capsulatum G186AR]